MNTENGKIDYRIMLDTSDMEAQREQVSGMFQGLGKDAMAEGAKIDNAFSAAATNIGKAFASLMAVSTFTSLSKKIMAVRGEFQQLEVAFETMLGSAEKANGLMNQLVTTAATTPFGLQDVAGGAKQLLAYGIAADEVNDTLVRLGDIAAGLSIPLNDLVYLYGTTMTQGRVYTQDMRQFMGRGIPLAEELAKQFGVTKDKVSELVTEGKVGFPEVKKAIESMTDAGGKFGGLMEKQSHTITGQISNIEDAIDMMFNDLGKQSEGVINTALGAVTFMVEHYKELGTVLLTVVAAYGEYKAALMVAAAVSKLSATNAAADTAAKAANTATTGLMTIATNLATRAVQALNAAWKANPFGLVLSAITLVVGAISMFKMGTEEATDSMEKFHAAAMEERNKLEAARAVIGSVSKESSVYKKAVGDLSAMAEEHGTKLEIENGIIKDQEIALKDLSNAITKAAAAKVVAEEASKAHKAAMDAEKEAMDRLKEDAENAAHVNTDGLTQGYTEASATIRQLTDTQWDYISQVVMSHAREINDAYAQSGEAGAAAAQKTLDEVNRVMSQMGVADRDLKAFQGSLIAYINSSADGFQNAYQDLGRVEHQMQGVVSATDDLKRSTEDLKGSATDTYDELQRKQEGIQAKIDEINASPLNPQVKDEQLVYLRGLLNEINGLMGNAQSGTINAAKATLDAAKKKLDEAAIGTPAYDEAKKAYQAAKKDYDAKYKDAYGGSSGKPRTTRTTRSGSTTKTDPKQIAYDVEEIQSDLEEQLNDFLEKLKEEFGAGVTSAMQEGTEKQLQQIEDDTQAKLKALDESIEQLRDKQAEADKQVWLKQNPKKKEYEYPTPEELSIEDFLKKSPDLAKAYADRKAQIEAAGNAAKRKISEDEDKREAAAMNAYLEEYGTYYQKRKAIVDQYQQRIKDAKNEGEILSLKRQMQSALGDLDFSVIQKSMGDLFNGDLAQIPTDQLKAFRDRLMELTEQAKDLSPEQIQAMADALNKAQTQIDMTNPIKAIKQARQEYKAAKEDFEKFDKAAKKANLAGDFAAEAEATEKANEAQNRMSEASKKAKISTERLMAVADEFAQTLDTAGNAIGGTAGELLKLAASGIGAGVAMANGMKMFKEAADNASKSVAILAIIQAAFQAVMALIDLFGGKEDKTLTAYVEAMDNYISMLTDTISDLQNEMSDLQNSMTETIAKYKELLSVQERSAAAIKAQSQVWLNSGASAKAHSEGYKIAKAISEGLNSSSAEVREYYKNGIDELSSYYKKVFGKSITGDLQGSLGRMDWLWKLSDADIKELAKNTELLSILGDDLSSAIINYAKSLQDMEDTLNEQYAALLSVTYDDFYNDFVDMISDMDTDSSDFAKRFGEYMRKALIQNMVATQYKERIKKLYEQAGKAAQNGTLEQELASLREEWAQIAKEARDEVKLINDITGGVDSSEADKSSGAWSALGEETGRSLDGRFAAMQIQVTQIAQLMQLYGESMTRFDLRDLQKISMINEMENLSFIANGYLERIARNTDPLPGIGTDIKKLVQNTDRL